MKRYWITVGGISSFSHVQRRWTVMNVWDIRPGTYSPISRIEESQRNRLSRRIHLLRLLSESESDGLGPYRDKTAAKYRLLG